MFIKFIKRRHGGIGKNLPHRSLRLAKNREADFLLQYLYSSVNIVLVQVESCLRTYDPTHPHIRNSTHRRCSKPLQRYNPLRFSPVFTRLVTGSGCNPIFVWTQTRGIVQAPRMPKRESVVLKEAAIPMCKKSQPLRLTEGRGTFPAKILHAIALALCVRSPLAISDYGKVIEINSVPIFFFDRHHCMTSLESVDRQKLRTVRRLCAVIMGFLGLLFPFHAVAAPQDDAPQENKVGPEYIQHLFSDQKAIWTSPAKIRREHLPWLIPLVSISGGLLATDSAVAKQLPSNSSVISYSRDLANAGAAFMAASSASFYFYGRLKEDERARETGVLSSEAAINSFAVTELLKFATGRERPRDDVRGRFFKQGSSFPSEHAAFTWSIATVLAHEYPNPLLQIAAYGTAGAVSISRITSHDHFPADIFVGSALGYLIGHQVYASHHNPDLGGANIGTFTRDRAAMYRPSGTTYVPMDSWVYSALDRLAALGYVETDIAGLRPWTRSECARLIQEAGDRINNDEAAFESTNLFYNDLVKEFASELQGPDEFSESRIEDVYGRVGVLAGQPLADDFHFGKTMVDDFGRPFGNGVNAITGLSSRTIAGPFSIYVRGEYQHAGTLPLESPATLTAISNVDGSPFAVPHRTGTLDRFRFLDAYVAFHFHDNLISFGKQTLWWGPGTDAPFLFSDNAEPLPLLRISRTSPFVLPWLFHYLGAIRYEFLWGNLNGQNFIRLLDTAGNPHFFSPPITPHTYIHGEKISFKPTRNFEFGFSETTLWGGTGFPLTFHNFVHSYSIGNGIHSRPGEPTDPGDRRSAFDWTYRLPFVRNWVTFFGDAFTEDEFSPVSFPRKSSFRVGLHMPQLPRLQKLDLNVEGIYTDIPSLHDTAIAYWNARFLSGYTNYGQIIGSWIGREDRGVTASATYHLAAQSNIQFRYRSQHANPSFIGGGRLRDLAANATFARSHGLTISGSVQYEHWAFPVLAPMPQSNVVASMELHFHPFNGVKWW